MAAAKTLAADETEKKIEDVGWLDGVAAGAAHAWRIRLSLQEGMVAGFTTVVVDGSWWLFLGAEIEMSRENMTEVISPLWSLQQ